MYRNDLTLLGFGGIQAIILSYSPSLTVTAIIWAKPHVLAKGEYSLCIIIPALFFSHSMAPTQAAACPLLNFRNVQIVCKESPDFHYSLNKRISHFLCKLWLFLSLSHWNSASSILTRWELLHLVVIIYLLYKMTPYLAFLYYFFTFLYKMPSHLAF